MATATYKKLSSGDWGVRVQGTAPSVGAEVVVEKRDGTRKTERVAKVVWQGADAALCAIASTRSAAPSRSRSGSVDYRMLRDGTPGPVRGCSACRAAGRMCRQCAFDEFDD